MSSERSADQSGQGPPETDSLMTRLRRVYNLYQQQHVYDRLNQIATEMEDTILQITIADCLFEESIDLSQTAQDTVASVRAKLDQREGTADDRQGSAITIDESDLDDLEDVVNTEAERVETRIHELRAPQASTVGAMEHLNEEVQVADSDQLSVLSELLSDWNWRDHIPDIESFEKKRAAAEEFADEMDDVLDDSRQKLGAGFEGEEIENLAETLLNGDQLSLKELDAAQRDALASSELGRYLTVSLG